MKKLKLYSGIGLLSTFCIAVNFEGRLMRLEKNMNRYKIYGAIDGIEVFRNEDQYFFKVGENVSEIYRVRFSKLSNNFANFLTSKSKKFLQYETNKFNKRLVKFRLDNGMRYWK